MAPHTLDGWRHGYLNAVGLLAYDLDAESKIIADALREIAGRRLEKRRAAS